MTLRRPRLAAALAALALAASGCVQVDLPERPAGWPASLPATPERLHGIFTGAPVDLARSAAVFFTADELYGPDLRRKVTALTLEARGDMLFARARFDSGVVIEGRLAGVLASDAFVIERRSGGREGPNVATYRNVWRLQPDADGGLVFEHIDTSVGLLGPLPFA